MKCNHCGKDIPQRIILVEAARILFKKMDTESDNLAAAAHRIGRIIRIMEARDKPIELENFSDIIEDLAEIRLLISKGAKR